ncbi:MAG: OprO/OprP family phosphate-selective porin [Tannerella sp.]|jgi:hypothetical protein|nr:OprO/OprP family phosphate-selective porin [Tannerella sp.]
MRKIFKIASLLLFVSSVFAQHRESENILEKLMWDDKMLNIMIDTRIDLQAEFQQDDLDEIGFRGQTFRLWFVGEIIPGIRYRIRHRFNKPQDPLIRDNYSSATDMAWLEFDIGKTWTFTAGRQPMQFGTFEYDYNGADIYLPTMVNGDIDLYKTGVNVAYKFSGQIMNLQVVNSDATQFATEEYKNKALSVNVLWVGNLFNKMLRTRWGYGALQHSKSKFYHWITMGTQLNIGDFTAEMDYFSGNRNIDYSSIVDSTDLGLRYVHDRSASLNLKWDLGKLKPSVKGVWNQRYDKAFDSNAYISKGIDVALELYPFTNSLVKDLRFHVAYVYTNIDFQGEFSGLKNENTHIFLIGTRWLFKAK